eukprot:4888108-Prymnesium_polylepis.1
MNSCTLVVARERGRHRDVVPSNGAVWKWCIAMLAATVALSELKPSAMGMEMRSSASASVSSARPKPSLPTSSATRSSRRAVATAPRCDEPPGVSAISRKPSSRRRSKSSRQRALQVVVSSEAG